MIRSIHQSLRYLTTKVLNHDIDKMKIDVEEAIEVAIVGAGPTGVMLSIMLSKFGIKHMLIDKKVSPSNHPQAHFINNRSMEILQDWAPIAFKQDIIDAPDSNDWR